MKEACVLRNEILCAMKEKHFIGFDTFIIREMGGELPEDERQEEEVRRKAFRTFRKKTDMYLFASMPTMRKWFGIGGISVPSRENVYKICFSLGVDKEKACEYLQTGLGQPAFFINDYFEMIYLYGLEHGLTFERCMAMVDVFEGSMEQDIRFSRTHTTNELQRQYESAKNLSEEEFVLWMVDRADWFRGYSRTSLDYLDSLKKAVLKDMREDARDELFRYLSEYDFDRWLKKRKNLPGGHKKSEKDYISSYLKKGKSNDRAIPEYDLEIMTELSQMAYGGVEANSRLLSEIYSVRIENEKEDNNWFPVMSDKHLSDLFHVPEKKEQSIRVSQGIRLLSHLPECGACPENIQKLISLHVKKQGNCGTVGEAKQLLVRLSKDNKRRCLLLQRDDILPMLLYLAQKRYIKENRESYDSERAVRYFVDMANSALNTCNMPVINEDFRLDFLLLRCFADEEMFSYSEMLDILGEEI